MNHLKLEKENSLQNEIRVIKQYKSEFNEDQRFIIENKVFLNDSEEMEKKSKEIYEQLLHSPTREDGGRNALFGFYYQFLVAIDYLIDVVEKRWDFMAFEIHDDIVLCRDNDDERTVRFVQVKTSKHPTVSYSATELVSRSKKTFGEGKKKNEVKVNDSWLDKLFMNAELFKGKSDIKQEFQLVTNFTFYMPPPSKEIKTKNINHYRNNMSFMEITIEEDDPFYKNLKESPTDLHGEVYSYDEKTGMSIKELLSKTNISERVDYLPSFRDGIAKRLGDMLSKQIGVEGGATVLDEDINWLVGEMCASCAQRDNKLVLFIDQVKADEIAYKLLQKSKRYSESFNEIVGNKKFIDEAFEKIIFEIKNEHPNAIEELEEVTLLTKQMINDWIENDGDILKIVSRFIMGREELIDFHTSMHKTEREGTIFTLALIFILLKVVNGETKISIRYKTILMNEVKNILGEEYDISLIKMEKYYSYDNLVEKVEDIMTKLHMETHEDLLSMMLNQPHKMIVEGDYDFMDGKNFVRSSVETISLSTSSNIDILGEEESSMTVVDYRFLMIPWHVMNLQYAKFKRDKEEFSDFKIRVSKLWNEISKAGELNDDSL
ncbi:dsDNA nuclease domain-containing protein [Lysinibacillus fusiformis]|uniref:dsDNA nuclease domain-containing protein n=1 Tax=Lysinibacillus fusiformis TaxID=28031 RepID=UPI003015B242